VKSLNRHCALGALVVGLALAAPPTQAAGKRYALLVAINTNHLADSELKDLEYAHSDATRLADLLVAQGFERPIVLQEPKRASGNLKELKHAGTS
jgi:hypothetical protein